MPTAELNEQSTTEDIHEYVDQVVKEVDQEQKGDAQITSEHADNEHLEKPAENKTGSGVSDTETSDTAETGEATSQEETGESWLDDDLKAEVAAYGIEESEIADFANREELERALRLFDKSAQEAGRKAIAETEGEKGKSRNEKGQFTKGEAEKKESPVEFREGAYEIKLDKNVYDEELVGEFTRMRDHYESRIQALEDRFIEVDARAEEQRFDGLVDSLGHADLFGKSGNENSKQLQRREDLFVAVKAQQIGLKQLGRPTELNESLVNRVARMVFAEDLGKKDLKSRTRKISKQSNSRQGGGATRPQDPREDPRDEFDRLYKELGGN